MKRAALNLCRRLAARSDPPEPFAALLRENLPSPRSRITDAEFLCLDIETTGLDPDSADVLSLGWVVVSGGRVRLATAKQLIVRPTIGVGDSASVHGLTDTQCARGVDVQTALDATIEAAAGRVLVVHHAGLDKALLDRLCRRFYGHRLLVPVVDTLRVEWQRRRRQGRESRGDSLRLGTLREAYHLPYYAGHDSLTDALATAELLLAMTEPSARLSDITTH